MKLDLKVIKTWGYEYWFANTARYCGKLLSIDPGKWSSNGAYHYHKIKDETFFVIEGALRLDYVTQEGEFKTIILEKFESFQVETRMKHRFATATLNGCKFIEAATTHRDSDSYRVYWDKENETWNRVT